MPSLEIAPVCAVQASCHSERSEAKSRNLSCPDAGEERCLDKLGMTAFSVGRAEGRRPPTLWALYLALALAMTSLCMTLVLGLVAGEIVVRRFSSEGYVTPDTLRADSVEYEATIFSRHAMLRMEQVESNAHSRSGYNNCRYVPCPCHEVA